MIAKVALALSRGNLLALLHIIGASIHKLSLTDKVVIRAVLSLFSLVFLLIN